EQARNRFKDKDDIAQPKRANESNKASAPTKVDKLQKELQARSKELAHVLAAQSAEYTRMLKILEELEERDKKLEMLNKQLEQLELELERPRATGHEFHLRHWIYSVPPCRWNRERETTKTFLPAN